MKAIHRHSFKRFHSQFHITNNGVIAKKFRYTIAWKFMMSGLLILAITLMFPQLISTASIPTFIPTAQETISPTLLYLKTQAPSADITLLKSIDEATSAAAKETKLDKNLLLATMKIESAFDPYAMSNKGAMCLMQIMPNWHADLLKEKLKLLDSRSIYDVDVCVHSGARILSNYIRDQGGSIERGLLQYNGSLADEAKTYAVKILAERKVIDKFVKDQK